MKYAIIGAGMAGLACADVLVRAGLTCVLYDKARGPGGRMSTRRVETPQGSLSFDHGAQYFTARDPAFCAQVRDWESAGVVARWAMSGVTQGAATESLTDKTAWVGIPAMNAPVRAMAAAHDVHWNSRVDALKNTQGRWSLAGEHYDGVIVALPAEQAAALLAPWQNDFAQLAQSTVSAPCWTVMAAFEAPLPTPHHMLRDDTIIGWAARNNSKPRRGATETWVVQASPQWSVAHLEAEAAEVTTHLLAQLGTCLGIKLPPPFYAAAHRWRYARSGHADSSNGHTGAVYDKVQQLGVCGDWLLGPRVECAWLSGTRLGHEIIAAGERA
jgi:renalase